MKKQNHHGATSKPAHKPKTPTTAQELALALADCIDEKGNVPITVKLYVTYHELLPLARKAKHENRTMGNIIEEYLYRDGAGQFIDFLGDYQNDLPEEEAGELVPADKKEGADLRRN